MKPYAYDRRDEHGSIQLHQGDEAPRVRADEKLIPLYSAAQVAELVAENAVLKNGQGSGAEFKDFQVWWNVLNADGRRAEGERMLAAGAWMARSGLGNTDVYQYVAAETPATDAYLSQLRNEARTEIAVMMEGHAARYDALAKQTEDFGVDNRYRYTAAMFRGVAKELREGKAGEVQS